MIRIKPPRRIGPTTERSVNPILSDLDILIFRFINDNANSITPIGRALTLASNWGDWLFALSLALLLIRYRKMACFGLAAAAVTVSVSRQIGKLIWRDRPFTAMEDVNQLLAHIDSNGFPSDHAAAAAAISFIVFRFSRPLGSLFIGAAAVVGFSRIWIGVHYPGDVLIGFVVGVACSYAVFKLLDRFRLYEHAVAWLRHWTARDSDAPSTHSRSGKST
jgi:undecaprenyl-diphosphatase